MRGCHRADRSIWALSTVLAIPISPLHCRLYSCCVSDCDTTHTYQFTEWWEEEGSKRKWSSFSLGCRLGACIGQQRFEIKCKMQNFWHLGGKKALHFPAHSRLESSLSYMDYMLPSSFAQTHIMSDSLMACMYMCSHAWSVHL